MFKCNTYFEGDVVSIAFNGSDGEATVGVMAPGEYEFGTSKQETMKVVSGKMQVKLPGESDFKPYVNGEVFIVEANQKFNLVVEVETAYLCLYK
jgi:purine/pyrimidine-nucleoside phosphorylase